MQKFLMRDEKIEKFERTRLALIRMGKEEFLKQFSSRLVEKERLMVSLHCYEGLELDEISTILNADPQYIRKIFLTIERILDELTVSVLAG